MWDQQPAPKDHPWRNMKNQAMTPHTSGTTLDAQVGPSLAPPPVALTSTMHGAQLLHDFRILRCSLCIAQYPING